MSTQNSLRPVNTPHDCPAPGSDLEEKLTVLAETNVDAFFTLFKRLRNTHKEELTRFCLRYLALHGLTPTGRRLQPLILSGNEYLALLLDPQFLSDDEAIRVAHIMHDASRHFTAHFQRELAQNPTLTTGEHLDRALALCKSVIGDCGVMVAWLRTLSQHRNDRLRAKAAGLLCAIRPSLRMIEHQYRSDDPRIRANAIESLWTLGTPSETHPILRAALDDESSRVVVNALVGLYRLDQPDSFARLLLLAEDPSPGTRMSVIWAFGLLADRRCIPALQKLAADPSRQVRLKAVRVLAALQPPEDAECGEIQTPQDQPVSAQDDDQKPAQAAPQPNTAEHEKRAAVNSKQPGAKDSRNDRIFNL